MQDFIHLNVHSHYSIMESQITIPAAVDKAVADGMKGMALTDVGVMYGIKEFADYCASYEIFKIYLVNKFKFVDLCRCC